MKLKLAPHSSIINKFSHQFDKQLLKTEFQNWKKWTNKERYLSELRDFCQYFMVIFPKKGMKTIAGNISLWSPFVSLFIAGSINGECGNDSRIKWPSKVISAPFFEPSRVARSICTSEQMNGGKKEKNWIFTSENFVWVANDIADNRFMLKGSYFIHTVQPPFGLSLPNKFARRIFVAFPSPCFF